MDPYRTPAEVTHYPPEPVDEAPPEPFKYSNGRLTPHGVAEVHRLRAAGQTYQAISNALGVCSATVYGTAKGKTNKDLHPAEMSKRLTLTRESVRVQTGVRAGTGGFTASGGGSKPPQTTPLRDMTEDGGP